MKIDIQSPKLEINDDLKQHLYKKAQFTLGRLEEHIQRVEVFLDDINGPKGGVDKVCSISLFTEDMGHIVAKDTHDELKGAISNAFEKASRILTKRLKKQITKQRHEVINQKLQVEEEDLAI